MQDGRPVTTAEMWLRERRPEFLMLFEREVYGRVPAAVPSVAWRVDTVDREFFAGRPVIAQQLVGHVDKPAAPGIPVDIRAAKVGSSRTAATSASRWRT
ncbi:hypothetical protein [Sphingomonas sp. 22176]|uniref:hypothetical protein n=1 Tax=Sphingomonas sp. 22176 TaxID=3453884 RepID=UPI003F86481E